MTRTRQYFKLFSTKKLEADSMSEVIKTIATVALIVQAVVFIFYVLKNRKRIEKEFEKNRKKRK